MIELKLCPFCGGKASLFVDDGVRVICNKCFACSLIMADKLDSYGVANNSVETVIRAWNRRANDEQQS